MATAGVQRLPASAWRTVLRHKKKSLLAALVSAAAIWKWPMVKTAGGFLVQMLNMLKMLSKMEEQQRKAAQRETLHQLHDQFAKTLQVSEQLLGPVLQQVLAQIDRWFAVDQLYTRIKELRMRKRQLAGQDAALAELNLELEELWKRFTAAGIGRSVAAVHAAALVGMLVHVQTAVIRRHSFTRAQQRTDAAPAAENPMFAGLGAGGPQPLEPQVPMFDQLDPELMQFLQQCTDALSFALVRSSTNLESFCELVSSATQQTTQELSLDQEFDFEEFWGLLRTVSMKVASRLRLRSDHQSSDESSLGFFSVASSFFNQVFSGGRPSVAPAPVEAEWSRHFFPSEQAVQAMFQSQYEVVLRAGRQQDNAQQPQQQQPPPPQDLPNIGIELGDPLNWEVAIKVGLGREAWPARDEFRRRLVDHSVSLGQREFQIQLTEEDMVELRRRQDGGAKPSAGVAGSPVPEPASEAPSPASLSLQRANRSLQFSQFLVHELGRGQDLAAEIISVLRMDSAGDLAAELVLDALLPTLKPFVRQSFDSLAQRQPQDKHSLPLVHCLIAQTGAYNKFVGGVGSPAKLTRSISSSECLEKFCKIVFFPVASPPVFEDPDPQPEPALADGMDQELQQLLMQFTGGDVGSGDSAELNSLFEGLLAGGPRPPGGALPSAEDDNFMQWLQPSMAPRSGMARP